MSCAPRRWFLPVLVLSSVLFATVVPIGAITVTSLADSGPGTLREAIGLANSDGVPTTITFAPGLACPSWSMTVARTVAASSAGMVRSIAPNFFQSPDFADARRSTALSAC